ncbi:hypothetical protein GLOTRDRAFT_138308 [Gloeophyllum trabeum ATCC 11539]|uniref:Uncharacterized protein n=1 Tax=Gloeophyllum trabeum (strain ATCC 11539 / FP-39264 / Madison 617) TaxID=670483 RepID=S7RTZ2_GLOTA|nr:uncharacterized protein GLOTRDRAFT_138308 [Gloeophyllum trabeum ATCC 11539]EPQ56629.1 hypothetical protein GLOTRDRAFT_138308 [Gloeophyllum trabeum ATCC 11539]
MAVILGMTYKQIIVASEPIPGVIICTPVGIPDFFFVFWVPIVVFESILFLLVVIQGVGHLKERSCSWSPTTLMDVLVRDSILYFFLTLTTYITNAVVWMTMSSTWLEVPEGFALAATCIMGSRLVLNMREAFFNPFHEGGIFVLSALGSGRAGRASPDLQFQRHGSVRSRAMLDEIELGDANWAETSGVMKPLAQGDR